MLFVGWSGVGLRAKAKDISPVVRTRFEVHPTFYSIGIACLPPRARWPERVPHQLPRICSTFKMSGVIPLPPIHLHGMDRENFYLLCLYLFLGITNSDCVLFINQVFHSLPLKSVTSGSVYPLFKVHLHLLHRFNSHSNITILIFQFPLVFVKFLSFFWHFLFYLQASLLLLLCAPTCLPTHVSPLSRLLLP